MTDPVQSISQDPQSTDPKSNPVVVGKTTAPDPLTVKKSTFNKPFHQQQSFKPQRGGNNTFNKPMPRPAGRGK